MFYGALRKVTFACVGEKAKLSVKAQTKSSLQLDKRDKYSQVIFDKILLSV